MSLAVPIFELKQVSQRYGALLALDQLSLKIYPGERVALIGASGAGKSTVLQLCNGTLQPSQGQVWILGRSLTQLSGRRRQQIQRQIGTIYQQFHLVNSLKVIHNVNAGHLGRWSFWRAALSLVYPLEIKTAAQVLERVGIPEKLFVRTDQLSGGQQQRVAIARVLVQNPAAILADEPVASLDPVLSREVMELLSTLVCEDHKTLLVSLHSVELALSYCDRVIGLRYGRIVLDAPTAAVTPDQIATLYRLQD